MRAPRDGNNYQDRRQDDRGNRGSQDNLRGAGHPGGRGSNASSSSGYNISPDMTTTWHWKWAVLVKLVKSCLQVEVAKGDAAIEGGEEGGGKFSILSVPLNPCRGLYYFQKFSFL